MQDLYNRRPCDSVWDICIVAFRHGLLARDTGRAPVKESKASLPMITRPYGNGCFAAAPGLQSGQPREWGTGPLCPYFLSIESGSISAEDASGKKTFAGQMHLFLIVLI